MNLHSRSTFLVVTVLVLSAPFLVGWVTTGVPVTTTSPGQRNPEIVADGTGGAFIVWSQYAGYPYYRLYAQRVNDIGQKLWSISGVRVCDVDTTYQEYPQLIADGAGGLIVAWGEQRGANYDLYAQRIDNAGVRLWNPSGVVVCSAPDKQDLFHDTQIVSDGAGGAIITWEDFRDSDWNIYAQRINASGTAVGLPNGQGVCISTGLQKHPALTSDGAGGAIIVWEDARRHWSARDIYAQRVDGSVVPLWPVNGVLLAQWSMQSNKHAQLVGDGVGGAIVAWDDDRGTGSHIYAKRISSGGVPSWAATGVQLAAVGAQHDPRMVSDGDGGAIVAWRDMRDGNPDVYVQRIDGTGSTMWTTDGVALCTQDSVQTSIDITTDGSGGAVVIWEDGRAGNLDIYSNHVGAGGNPLWTSDGIAVAAEPQKQFLPQVAYQGTKGAFVTWVDLRHTGYRHDVYVRYMRDNVTAVTVSSPVATLGQNRPNPFNPVTTIEYTLQESSPVVVGIYDVSGKRVAQLDQGIRNAGTHAVEWNGRDANGAAAASGVYFYRIEGVTGAGTRKMVLLK